MCKRNYTYIGEVKLWDTPSAQCIRTLPHKGTVVTVQFMPTPSSLIDRWILVSRWQSNPWCSSSGTDGSQLESWLPCRKDLSREGSSLALFSEEKICRVGIGMRRLSQEVDKLILRRWHAFNKDERLCNYVAIVQIASDILTLPIFNNNIYWLSNQCILSQHTCMWLLHISIICRLESTQWKSWKISTTNCTNLLWRISWRHENTLSSSLAKYFRECRYVLRRADYRGE